MTHLADYQRAFAQHLRSGDQAVLAQLAPAAQSTRRAGVYAHAYRQRLCQALAREYPGLQALIGDDAFEAMALDYLLERPSRHYDIRWFGAQLPAWLRSLRQLPHPAAAEMARLEWALSTAFDALEVPSAGPQALAAVPARAWPELLLRLHPGVQLLNCRWNVGLIRRAVDRGESIPAPKRLHPDVDWSVWRLDGAVRHRALPLDERRAVRALARGATLSQIAAQLQPGRPAQAVPERLVGLLRGWAESGWLAVLPAPG